MDRPRGLAMISSDRLMSRGACMIQVISYTNLLTAPSPQAHQPQRAYGIQARPLFLSSPTAADAHATALCASRRTRTYAHRLLDIRHLRCAPRHQRACCAACPLGYTRATWTCTIQSASSMRRTASSGRATGIHGLLTCRGGGARCVVSRRIRCTAPSPNVASADTIPHGPARHRTHVGGAHHAAVTQARARVPPPQVLGKSPSAIPPPALSAPPYAGARCVFVFHCALSRHAMVRAWSGSAGSRRAARSRV
ncbi:hypothetical protein FA95DRAFT_1024745 [Auriscalpium vulgare]|uniref:Uncharacterized protein n=1 Tax=Auriscalpium vulgare TaxID=40419 RepID=A0ACB8RWR1_9AGAM|nr:hypothetical protein FA95DRAFT_1024745 [Auriscalpium vulgare]